MRVERRDGGLWADIFWDDLSSDAQAELLSVIGDNGNYDVYPITSINVSSYDEQLETD